MGRDDFNLTGSKNPLFKWFLLKRDALIQGVFFKVGNQVGETFEVRIAQYE